MPLPRDATILPADRLPARPRVPRTATTADTSLTVRLADLIQQRVFGIILSQTAYHVIKGSLLKSSCVRQMRKLRLPILER